MGTFADLRRPVNEMEEHIPASFTKVVHLYNACGDLSSELCAAAIAVRIAEPARQHGRTPVRFRRELRS
jgi:hypothetical protein